MFASGPSPAVAYQLSLKLVSLLRLVLLRSAERASAHRGTGVAIVLLTHPRALRSHARGLTGLSV